MIKAQAIVMGKKYKGEGKTVKEALESIQIKNGKGKCVLAITDGDKTKERVLMPAMSFKLFSASGMMREIAIKNISQMFV